MSTIPEVRKREPRPKSLTPAMALTAATRTAGALARDGLIQDSEVARCAADIAAHARMHMDGYEIAKVLDDRCYWDCDLMMADALDAYGWEARKEIKTAQEAWAEREAITPPHPTGTRVGLKNGDTGVITDISEYDVASYCVKVDGDVSAEEPHRRRRIVAFEDAEAC